MHSWAWRYVGVYWMKKKKTISILVWQLFSVLMIDENEKNKNEKSHFIKDRHFSKLQTVAE